MGILRDRKLNGVLSEEGDTHGQNPVLTDDQVPELIRDPLQTRSQSCGRLKTTDRIKLS